MAFFIESKEKIRRFYAQYSYMIVPVLRFFLALAVFCCIDVQLDYVPALGSIYVLLLLSLISCIMPLNVMVFFGVFLIVGQCYGVGTDVAAFALILLLTLIILFLRFASEDALVLLMTPLAYAAGIPCAIPIGYGLLRGPSSAVSAGCGVVIYYFMKLVRTYGDEFQADEADMETIMDHLKLLLDGLLKNQLLLITIVSFVTVLLIVNMIRRLSLDYAWQIAIVAGGLAYLVVMIAGGVLDLEGVSALSLILGDFGAMLAGFVIQFFMFHMDYRKTEYLQYADDEYYYFVKAVPRFAAQDMRKPGAWMGNGPKRRPDSAGPGAAQPVQREDGVDYQSRLEDSLRDL